MLAVLLGLLAIVVLVPLGLVAFSAFIASRVEKAVPPRGRFIEIDGTRIHYVDEGAGQAIVLVHGLAAQMQHLTYALGDRLKQNYRIVALDRPGAGYSERRPGASARLTEQAAVIAALIDKLGLDRPLVLGHSLGGAVALATALDHPNEVGGLALIAPLTHTVQDPPAALMHLAVASPLKRHIIAWTIAVPSIMRTGKAALAEVFAPDPVPADFATRGGGLLGLRPKAFYSASSDMVAVRDDLDDLVARYPTLRMPVGILYGIGDRILDYRAQGEAMVGKVPGLTLETIENAGHMLPVSAAERTARFVADIAEQVRRAAPAAADGATVPGG